MVEMALSLVGRYLSLDVMAQRQIGWVLRLVEIVMRLVGRAMCTVGRVRSLAGNAPGLTGQVLRMVAW